MIWTLRDTWAITRRDMTRWVAQPVTIVAELAYPITFVLLFAYVFGSAMTVPGGGDYQEFLMPGMFVQTPGGRLPAAGGPAVPAVEYLTAAELSSRSESPPCRHHLHT